MQMSYSICTMGSSGPFASVDLSGLGFVFTHLDLSMFSWESDELKAISIPSNLIKERADLDEIVELQLQRNDNRKRTHGSGIFEEIQKSLWKERIREAKERAASIAWWNSLQCRKKPIFGKNLKDVATVLHPVYDIHLQKSNPCCYMNYSSNLADIILSPVERFQRITKLVECFMFVIPAARAPSPVYWCSKSESPVFFHRSYNTKCTEALAPLLSPIRPAIVRRQVYFPDRRLIQFDCGKLQELAVLLRRLKSEGHRALIFTQMTKMLDILEAFINLYGYTYMRLDGSTQPEERQTLMQRFNTNPKIFLFILSTRSGGVGINLVGADTVIFYDSDWNPAMDQQAQDRCHRIGQTRQVHIYRLISESTIEENILKKANQKRSLDDLVIQSGSYNTEFFKKLDPMELFSGHTKIPTKSVQREKSHDPGDAHPSNADVEAALKQAEDEADYMALKKVEQEEVVDNQEFTDEAIVRLEDDEFGNEDTKLEENSGDQSGLITVPDKDVSTRLNPTDQSCGRALTFSRKDEDFDMLADMKQLAADAANAGQASSSFECQLRPIDRYAMRFLELWDPIIDKSAIESQVILEEKEWELDRLKKFKEEAEADIDGDEEPLVYERWDAEFASVAYKQQVEALAQSQLPKDMECAMEAAEAAYVYCEPSRKEIDFKPKSKNKTKKKKFRSLKKGALASQPEAAHDEPSLEIIPIDYDDGNSDMFECSDYVTSPSPFQRKRKKAQGTLEDDKKFSKKKKKDHSQSSQFILDKLHGEGKVSKGSDNMVMDLDHKLISRNKMGGKISISVMPAKRILVIKPEKLNKKGSIWLRGCSVSPDLWSSQEDVILCAIVHEYGTNWSLVSDMLYGMTAGGSYRGRFHHPVNCCERFRELFQRYVLSMTENPTNEKFGNTGPGKAIFRATEDSIRTLLDVASDLPDNELLLQKHLTAVISSVWRSRSRVGCWQGMTAPFGNHAFRKIMPGKQWNFSFAGLRQSSKLVGAALHDANTKQQDAIFPPSQMIEAVAEVEKLDVTLEFHTGDDYSEIPLPSSINLTICGPDQSSSADESNGGGPLLDPLSNTAEKRFRVAPNTCFDGKSSGWALSAFSSGDFVQIRSTLKQQYLGKNNTPLSDSIRSAESSFSRISNELLEEQHPIYNVTFSSPEPLAATDPVVSFDSFVVTDDAHSIGHDEYPTCDRTNESLVPDSNIFEAVPHHYDPDIISGLDDCTNLPDFTDMG